MTFGALGAKQRSMNPKSGLGRRTCVLWRLHFTARLEFRHDLIFSMMKTLTQCTIVPSALRPPSHPAVNLRGSTSSTQCTVSSFLKDECKRAEPDFS
jgi:hypothetical protein